MDYDCNQSIANAFREIRKTVYKACQLIDSNKISEASFSLGVIVAVCGRHEEIFKEKFEDEEKHKPQDNP